MARNVSGRTRPGDEPGTALPSPRRARALAPGTSPPREVTRRWNLLPRKGDAVRDGTPRLSFDSLLFDRIWSFLSRDEDPDGPINTDRPTFTPATTVVPAGRLQFESGFTFDYQQGTKSRTTAYDFPELAMRLGLTERVEFRTFWFGQT